MTIRRLGRKHRSLAATSAVLTLAASALLGPATYVAAAATTDTASAVPITPDFSAGSPVWAVQDRLDAMAAAVASVGARLSAEYGGVRVDAAADKLHVYLTPSGMADSSSFVVLGVLSEYDFVPVAHSLASLQQTRDKFAARIKATLGKVDVTSVAVDEAANTVDVGVASSAAANQPDVAAMADLGVPVAYHVESTQYVPYSNRSSDSAPWNGGDGIQDPVTTNGCTLGPIVYNSGGTYALTAAHCFGPGVSFRNYTNGVGGSGAAMGSERTARAESTTDSELLNLTGGGSKLDWNDSGPVTGGSKAQQGSARGPQVGDYMCMSGDYDGVQCHGAFQSTNPYQCIGEADGTTTCTYFDQAVAPGGEPLAGNGDSGGPVYAYDGAGHTVIFGTITGPSPGTTQFTCSQYPAGRMCDNHIIFGDITAELSGYGVSLKIS